MQENVVIVESPAKATTIGRFLGKDYKVLSSYGHIRDLKKKDLSIDMQTLCPCYEVPADKQKVVNELRAATDKARQVWLASDEDREGEAIAWHLQEVLSLDPQKTKRIVFHEITRSAILHAIDNPRAINMNLVEAQTARRVLDRMVGFTLSPVLWRKVKPALSAGRVQSVAVRLLVEREREIQQFAAEPYYRVAATFLHGDDNGRTQEIQGELSERFATRHEAEAFLSRCANATFTVDSVAQKPTKRSPAPPFTTSTLQQEAARRLNFSVAQTMRIAQSLYENGLITYMRTDSVNLSTLCLGASKQEVQARYGEEYAHPRNYHTQSHGAQEAHEAIRPTSMDKPRISGTAQEQRLYNLIWQRTIASQMAEAQVEKTVITIAVEGEKYSFVATGEVVLFDGFLKVYHDTTDDDAEADSNNATSLPQVQEGDSLQRKEITATERYTQAPPRYTEGTLVKKLEELGIGRPSTYAPTISTIQQREYVVKGDNAGAERQYAVLTLTDNDIVAATKKEMVGKEKGKLLPTDVGMVVNDFLLDSFPGILDYNFTANVEEKFDHIAVGDLPWHTMIQEFWEVFEPEVKRVLNARNEHKVGERILGTDNKTGKVLSVKIGRYGPVVQLGGADDKEKPRFAQLPKGKSMDTITFAEAIELFRLPRVIGDIDGKEVTIGAGRFGPYILYDKHYTSLPATEDPLTVSLDTAKTILAAKHEQEQQKHIKRFAEDDTLEILNGRYGPYIVCAGKNYRIPKEQHGTAQELTYEECRTIVATAQEKGTNTRKRRRS